MKFTLQLIGIIYSVIFLHELGHTLAALYFNLNVTEFKIGFFEIFTLNIYNTKVSLGILPLGGFIKADTSIHIWQNIIVYLAGPFVNLMFLLLLKKDKILILCKEFFNSFRFVPIKIKSEFNFSLWNLFLTLHCMFFVFNMIPLLPLDGGKVLISIISYFINEDSFEYKLILTISSILGLGFIIYSFVKPIIVKYQYKSYKNRIDKILINKIDMEDELTSIKDDIEDLELYGIYKNGNIKWMSYDDLFYTSFTKEFKEITLLLLLNKTGIYASH